MNGGRTFQAEGWLCKVAEVGDQSFWRGGDDRANGGSREGLSLH